MDLALISVVAYYEAKLRNSGDKESPTFRPLKTESASNKHLSKSYPITDLGGL
jgi:hypothetical protein